MAGALLAGCGETGSESAEGEGAAGEVTVTLPPATPAAAPETVQPAESKPASPAELPMVAAREEPAAPPPKADAPKAAAAPAEPSADAVAEAAEPEAATEPEAAAEPAASDALVEASPPIAAEGLAGYIRGAGFQCDRVVTTSRAAGGGPYKFDCAAGGSYRGTMKRGRLYFRPWSGRR